MAGERTSSMALTVHIHEFWATQLKISLLTCATRTAKRSLTQVNRPYDREGKNDVFLEKKQCGGTNDSNVNNKRSPREMLYFICKYCDRKFSSTTKRDVHEIVYCAGNSEGQNSWRFFMTKEGALWKWAPEEGFFGNDDLWNICAKHSLILTSRYEPRAE